MVTKTAAYPDIAIPPGEFLTEEIEARQLSHLSRLVEKPDPCHYMLINLLQGL